MNLSDRRERMAEDFGEQVEAARTWIGPFFSLVPPTKGACLSLGIGVAYERLAYDAPGDGTTAHQVVEGLGVAAQVAVGVRWIGGFVRYQWFDGGAGVDLDGSGEDEDAALSTLWLGLVLRTVVDGGR
jgi:hypothetical protein